MRFPACIVIRIQSEASSLYVLFCTLYILWKENTDNKGLLNDGKLVLNETRQLIFEYLTLFHSPEIGRTIEGRRGCV